MMQHWNHDTAEGRDQGGGTMIQQGDDGGQGDDNRSGRR